MSDARTITPTHRPSNISTVTPLPPSMAQCKAIDRALAPLAKWRHWDFHCTAADLEQAAARVRELWPTVNCPATTADIGIYVGMLLACFSDQRTAEQQRIFQHLLLHDVSNRAPSLYALAAGCERLRLKLYRFKEFRIGDVIAAIDYGRAKSKRARELIEALPRMHPRRPGDREQYWVEDEADARQRLRKYIEDIWPPLRQHDFRWDDLRRLGLTGLCKGTELSWDGLKEVQKMEKSEVLARLDRLDAAEAETPKPPTLSEPPVKKPMARARARNRRAKGGRR
jgi:hypothetical protein